jgi:acylphosphatase
MERVRAHVTIGGRVQGVNFRASARERARSAGVEGWVRNRRDGTVEARVQGTPAAVDRLVEWARRGPPAARVADVDVIADVVDASLSGFARLPTA